MYGGLPMKQNKRIVIVDYGLGNLYSLSKALLSLNNTPIISEDPKDIRMADALFLPGVGAFPTGMAGLERRGLIEPIKTHAKNNKPIFGICLGMQLMMSESEEFGHHTGLDIIHGNVIPFTDLPKEYKIPHIGWNQINQSKNSAWTDPLFHNIPKIACAYFVHSFYPVPDNAKNVLAETMYGTKVFCSVARQGTAYGSQFHPEKSGSDGIAILKNFLNFVNE